MTDMMDKHDKTNQLPWYTVSIALDPLCCVIAYKPQAFCHRLYYVQQAEKWDRKSLLIRVTSQAQVNGHNFST